MEMDDPNAANSKVDLLQINNKSVVWGQMEYTHYDEASWFRTEQGDKNQEDKEKLWVPLHTIYSKNL